MCGHPRLQLVVPITTVLCSTRGLVVIAQEQCYEIDRLRPGFAMVLFMSVREAPSLRLYSLDQGAQESRDSEVARRCEVILHGQLIVPSGTRIILSFSEEHPASAQDILVRNGIQEQEQVRLHHVVWLQRSCASPATLASEASPCKMLRGRRPSGSKAPCERT